MTACKMVKCVEGLSGKDARFLELRVYYTYVRCSMGKARRRYTELLCTTVATLCEYIIISK
jgi:hypothetical protein